MHRFHERFWEATLEAAVTCMCVHLGLQVVCRQLGFLSTGAVEYRYAHFGRGNGSIVLDNVQCRQLRPYITDCSNNGLYLHNCGHYEDAGVSCQGEILMILDTRSAQN